MKVYQVIYEDEYHNSYLIGFYKDLDDCIGEINEYLGDCYPHLEKGDLREYPSTFSFTFDTPIYDKDECNCVYVRGFILDSGCLLEDLERLKKEIENDK